jgi:hypothetical protein
MNPKWYKSVILAPKLAGKMYVWLSVIISLALYALLGATLIPSQALTLFLLRLYSPVMTLLIAAVGNTLAAFLDAHAPEILTGVHILPFYPYSSDDGFSVMDYYAVDPGLGTWDDVARVGAHFDLMFDAVINHASAQGTWFQKFLQDEPPYRDFFIVAPDEFETTRVIRPRALPLLTEVNTVHPVRSRLPKPRHGSDPCWLHRGQTGRIVINDESMRYLQFY